MIERIYKNAGVEFRVFEDDCHAIGSKGDRYLIAFNSTGAPAQCECPGFKHRSACKHIAAALPIVHLMFPELAKFYPQSHQE